MRMVLPPLRERRAICRTLATFYETHRKRDFDMALAAVCSFYQIKKPAVRWRQSIDRGATWGLCLSNGHLHLIHPLYWKASAHEWVETTLHECGHLVFFADAERKADLFAQRVMGG